MCKLEFLSYVTADVLAVSSESFESERLGEDICVIVGRCDQNHHACRRRQLGTKPVILHGQ
eukprot:scaffold4637_cov76-Amphora_coffeaeformis.AAC.1